MRDLLKQLLRQLIQHELIIGCGHELENTSDAEWVRGVCPVHGDVFAVRIFWDDDKKDAVVELG